MNPWPSLDEARTALRDAQGEGIRIAVLDSGIGWDHPDLAGMRRGTDVHIRSDRDTIQVERGDGTDSYGHGTAVASVLYRFVPMAHIGSIRVLNPDLRSRVSIICAGAREALRDGYHVLNCSFGCRGEFAYLPHFKDWIDEAYRCRAHVVSAASNLDPSIPEWPGHFPTVLNTTSGRVDSEAMYRARIGSLIEFLAPGEAVRVAWLDGTRKCVTGSSFAAPVIASALTRLLSAFPRLSPLSAKALLLELSSSPAPS